MSNKNSQSHLMNIDPDLDGNFRRLKSKRKTDISPTDIEQSKCFIPVHGTTTKRLHSILSSGSLMSHSLLKEHNPAIYNDRLNNATDELDSELGFDNYVFCSIGRTLASSLGSDYETLLVIDPNIISEGGNLVAMQEIAEYGALVSPESKIFYKSIDPSVDIDGRNKTAITKYSNNILWGKDFSELFPRFLKKNFPKIDDFYTNDLFPGDIERTYNYEGQKVLENYRQGPQLQIPGSISTDKIKAIISTTDNLQIDRDIGKIALEWDIPFASMKNLLSKGLGSRYPNIKHYPIIQLRGFVHMAMRDIGSLLQKNDHKDLEQRLLYLWGK